MSWAFGFWILDVGCLVFGVVDYAVHRCTLLEYVILYIDLGCVYSNIRHSTIDIQIFDIQVFDIQIFDIRYSNIAPVGHQVKGLRSRKPTMS